MASGAGHAGDLTPKEAMDVLVAAPDAVLIDVRTPLEWETVGIPDLGATAGKPVFLEWLSAPSMTPNPAFAAEIASELAARGATPDTPLLFLCRSGARSNAAATAVTAMGYAHCHNIVGGFEGSPGQGIPGWKQSGLPWTHG